jgi:chemotaxis protein methyltransferase WspC
MLMKNGLCYFSAVEVPLVLGSGFAQAGSSMTFACRKELLPSPVRFASDVIPRETSGSRRARRQGPARAWIPSASSEGPHDDLQEARKLAEIGDWQGAIRKCEQHLSRNTLCSDGHFLLGRLFDVLGEESKAIEAFRRVLFLEPDHYESIRRLAVAAQQEGNFSRAQALNRRAERIRPSTPQDHG